MSLARRLVLGTVVILILSVMFLPAGQRLAQLPSIIENPAHCSARRCYKRFLEVSAKAKHGSSHAAHARQNKPQRLHFTFTGTVTVSAPGA